MNTIEAKTTSATRTTPPRQPTADDVALLSFAQSVELTVRDLYDEAINSGAFSDDVAAAISTIRESHEAYGQALSGLLGRSAPNGRDEALFKKLQGDFTGDAASVAAAAAQLENVAVATHGSLIGQLTGTDGADLVASILVVEARHATVLNVFAGATSLDDQLADKATALVPPTN